MSLFKTIKWLLNHPPTSLINKVPEGTVCDYCKSGDGGLWLWVDLCYCKDCFRKVLNKNLKKKRSKV